MCCQMASVKCNGNSPDVTVVNEGCGKLGKRVSVSMGVGGVTLSALSYSTDPEFALDLMAKDRS